MSVKDRLGGDSSNSHHSKTSIHQLRPLLLGHSISSLGGEGVKSEVTRFTLSSHGGLDSGDGDANIEETDPHEELLHGSSGNKGIVRTYGGRNGLKRVHLTRDADEVSGDEAHDGKHGSAAMTDLRLAEVWNKRSIALREFQLR